MLGIGVALGLLLFVPARAGSQTTASTAQNPEDVIANVIQPAVALVEYPDDHQHGTAVCISFKNGTAYLLTNEHVIVDERTGKLQPFVVVFPGHPTQRLPARAVREGSNKPASGEGKAFVPDLAVIAVDAVPFEVATLKINASVPRSGKPVSIAGFTYTQTDTWIKHGRTYLGLANGPGTVSDPGGPFDDVFIGYNAPTFDGESGGPLYDPGNGSLFGIVRATVASAEDGYAVPAATVRKFLDGVKEVTYAVYNPPESLSGNQVHVATRAPRHVTGTPSCLAALAYFSQDYAEWHQLRALVDKSRAPKDANERLRRLETALKTDAHAVASTSNARTARLTDALAAEIERFDAGSPGTLKARLQLTGAVARTHSITTCSPGA